MYTVIFMVIGIMVLGIVLAIIKKASRLPKDDEKWPFYAKKVMTQPEQVLYFRLKEALPDQIVLAQVQLSRFLNVKKGNNRYKWLNRINRLSADFIVCQKDASVIAVIELDDSSHKNANRRKTDLKKDRALDAAQVPIIRWSTQSIPDAEGIKAALIDWNRTDQRQEPILIR